MSIECSIAVIKQLVIMGFKATLHLCQAVAGEWVPTWLVAGIGAEWQRRGVAMLSFTFVRLTVVATCVQIDAFLQANLYFS